MNIAMVNMTAAGSTGSMMLSLADAAQRSGHTVYTYSPHGLNRREQILGGRERHLYYSKWFERKADNLIGRIFGCNGMTSFFGTRRLLRSLRRNQVRLIHLHNLHNYCINLKMLFRYIQKNNIRVVWTLHDCWAFTGHCPHFEMVGCSKWKTGCSDCPQLDEYPQSKFDSSRQQYHFKKKLFNSIGRMILVTPSKWLAGMVKQSFLKEHPVKVINNGIDLNIFKPRRSDFRARYSIPEEKILILGVSMGWGKKKGLDVFSDLVARLDPEKYQIVLVGTDARTDAKLSEGVISIHRTQDREELAAIYSAADIFVNPTREDTFPTVNIEALACGTPVITFDRGGSPEMIDSQSGAVVKADDIDALERCIVRNTVNKRMMEDHCIERAKRFDIQRQIEEYLRLYDEGEAC